MLTDRLSTGQRRPVCFRRLDGQPDRPHRRPGHQADRQRTLTGRRLRLRSDPLLDCQRSAHHWLSGRPGAQGSQRQQFPHAPGPIDRSHSGGPCRWQKALCRHRNCRHHQHRQHRPAGPDRPDLPGVQSLDACGRGVRCFPPALSPLPRTAQGHRALGQHELGRPQVADADLRVQYGAAARPQQAAPEFFHPSGISARRRNLRRQSQFLGFGPGADPSRPRIKAVDHPAGGGQRGIGPCY